MGCNAFNLEWHGSRRMVRLGLLVAAVVATHVILLAWGASSHSPTCDEIGHLPAGLSHWFFGNFELFRVNPPLVRMVATIPLVVAPPHATWRLRSLAPDRRPEFDLGKEMIQRNADGILWYFTFARWACIPFSVLGAWICFCWARELHGAAAGLTALTLWCLSPAILGHAQLITPDTAAAAMGVAASFMFRNWLLDPHPLRAFAAGVAMGLAELTKFTWIILFGLWPLLWLMSRIGNRSGQPKSCWHKETTHIVFMLGLGVYLVNLGYGFEGTGTRLGDFQFVSRALGSPCRHEPGSGLVVGNRFAGSCLGDIPVPLPANYLKGIDLQKLDFERGYWSYLRGEWRYGGWWYYYLYALAIKVPLGTWVVVVLALGVAVFARGYNAGWRDELMLIAPIVVVLTLVSSQTGFNHHMRYVLPVFPFAFIWISKVERCVDLGHWKVAAVAGAALVWSVASSLYYYPHSLSYFNELVGGPKHGHEHLLNSNIDWGQDLLLLKKWLDNQPDVQPIGLAYSLPKSLMDAADIGIKYTLPAVGQDGVVPDSAQSNAEFGPLPGWYAIFVGAMRDRHRRYAYFEHFEPVEMLGYTVRIYHISVDDANRVRRKLGLPEVGAGEAPKA